MASCMKFSLNINQSFGDFLYKSWGTPKTSESLDHKIVLKLESMVTLGTPMTQETSIEFNIFSLFWYNMVQDSSCGLHSLR